MSDTVISFTTIEFPNEELMEKYQNSLPSGEEKFDKGNPKKLSLSCWGVEVEIY